MQPKVNNHEEELTPEQLRDMETARTKEDFADGDLAGRRIQALFEFAAKGSSGANQKLQSFLSLTNPALRDRYFDKNGRVLGMPEGEDLNEMVASAQQIMGISEIAQEYSGGNQQPAQQQAPQQAIGTGDSYKDFMSSYLRGDTVKNRPANGKFYQDIANRPAESQVYAEMNPNRVAPEQPHGSPQEFWQRYTQGRYVPAGYQQDGQVYQDMANRPPESWDPNAPMSPTNGDDEINRLTHEAIASRVGYHRPEPRGQHNSPQEFQANYLRGDYLPKRGQFLQDIASRQAESYDPRAPLSPTNPNFDLVGDIIDREMKAQGLTKGPAPATAKPDSPSGTVVQHDTTTKQDTVATEGEGAISTGSPRGNALQRATLMAAIAGGDPSAVKLYNELKNGESARAYREHLMANARAGSGSGENWQLVQNDDGTFIRFDKKSGRMQLLGTDGHVWPFEWSDPKVRSQQGIKINNLLKSRNDNTGEWVYSPERGGVWIELKNGKWVSLQEYQAMTPAK